MHCENKKKNTITMVKKSYYPPHIGVSRVHIDYSFLYSGQTSYTGNEIEQMDAEDGEWLD